MFHVLFGAAFAKRIMLFGAALGALVLVGVSGALSAQAAVLPDGNGSTHAASTSGAIEVTPDGWIHYASVLGKVGATGVAQTVAGTRDSSGGCQFSGSGSALPGDVSVNYNEEVAYNPATCESTSVSASVTGAQLSQIKSLTRSPDATVSGTTASTPTTTLAAAATVYSRTMDTSWIDPISITITQQKAALQWTNTTYLHRGVFRHAFAGCIGSVCLDQTVSLSQSAPFVVLTGGWKQSALVHFQNGSFALWMVGVLGPTGWAACGFPTSNNADFWMDDRVTGLKTGASSWSWSDQKSGACTNLVHHGDAAPATYL